MTRLAYHLIRESEKSPNWIYYHPCRAVVRMDLPTARFLLPCVLT